MRVIAGRAKGLRLKKVPGAKTRPIMDRVKESLFNILAEFVPGTRCLDLFAGTGQVGIEALSRGASHVTFVDSERPAIRTVTENLARTKLGDRAEIIHGDAFAYLTRYSGVPYDLIYVAPPQYRGMWLRTLEILDERLASLLSDEGVVVVQIDPRELEAHEVVSLKAGDQRRYGNTLLCFYEWA